MPQEPVLALRTSLVILPQQKDDAGLRAAPPRNGPQESQFDGWKDDANRLIIDLILAPVIAPIKTRGGIDQQNTLQVWFWVCHL